MRCPGFTKLTPFSLYPYQVTVPKFYENVDSQESVIFGLCCKIQNLIEYSETQTATIAELQDAMREIASEFEEFKSHGFDDYYADQVARWIDENANLLFDRLARQVYFGLTSEGYFVAYIPRSWDDIIFDTGYDYSKDTYGRLILRFDTDGYSTVNQTPETREEVTYA